MSNIVEKEIKQLNEDEEISIYNPTSFINFIQNNIIQLLLLVLVFVVIYVVDCITNFNNVIIAIQNQQMMKEQMKIMKKNKFKPNGKKFKPKK